MKVPVSRHYINCSSPFAQLFPPAACAALTLDDDEVGDLVDAKVVPGEAGVVARVSQLDRRDAKHAAV